MKKWKCRAPIVFKRGSIIQRKQLSITRCSQHPQNVHLSGSSSSGANNFGIFIALGKMASDIRVAKEGASMDIFKEALSEKVTQKSRTCRQGENEKS